MTQDSSNVGNQFKGIIGNSLLTDSLEGISTLRNIVQPHADKIFSNPMASDREILDHPAVKAHNQLVIAKMHLEHALDLHNSGKDGFFKPIILSHLSIMSALKASAQVPELHDDLPSMAEHFTEITQNLTKLSNLNGRQQN